MSNATDTFERVFRNCADAGSLSKMKNARIMVTSHAVHIEVDGDNGDQHTAFLFFRDEWEEVSKLVEAAWELGHLQRSDSK